jgi:hypothetical protein
VYRATILSIVLALAVGQNAALLCGAWCFPQKAATACQHQATATSAWLASHDDCSENAAGAIALREDARRSAPSPLSVEVVASTPDDLAPGVPGLTLQSRAAPFHSTPPLIALRI